MSLLNQIIDEIRKNKWCFNYNGACSTCGMEDVKNYLAQYKIDEIIRSFEEYDYENIVSERSYYFIGLKKIYSLLTNYYEEFDFGSFEQRLSKLYPENIYAQEVISSNYNTYWDAWEKKQIQKEIDQKEYAQWFKKTVIIRKADIQNDHQLRKSQYRKDLIQKLFELDIKKRVSHIANDREHEIKFYPSLLILEKKEEWGSCNIDDLKQIYRKALDARRGPWSVAKKILKTYLDS